MSLHFLCTEEASLSMTREYSVEGNKKQQSIVEIKFNFITIFFLDYEEDNIMYSICTYMAENDDALNLVEGEKVYVIGTYFRKFILQLLWMKLFS